MIALLCRGFSPGGCLVGFSDKFTGGCLVGLGLIFGIFGNLAFAGYRGILRGWRKRLIVGVCAWIVAICAWLNATAVL